ncbi:MAG: N-6 DNA methylase [Candidatus Margulisiibacteriota bacterium]|jgi:type I restriction-modification system DNA methylase subunit
MSTKEQAKKKIAALIEKYELIAKAGKLKDFNEANTRKDFIMPLFEALGWDIRNSYEVAEEENVSNGIVDYAFKLNGITKFYLEAKQISVDLEEERWAEQTIDYAWYKSVTWAVLSDFEGVKIFNAEWREPYISKNLFIDLKYTEYLERFDDLWLLSKESLETGLLGKKAEQYGKKAKRRPVNEAIFDDLLTWRKALLEDLNKLNQTITLSGEEKEEVVQKILDRLIFIRSCEDRKIENERLRAALRDWEEKDKKGELYDKVVAIFEYYHFYDTSLFAPGHPCEKVNLFNGTINSIINGLYYNGQEKIHYDFKSIPADVLGGIYEQYLGHILKRGKLVEGKPHRKEQGIYYTPKYIVDYIVENTLGKLLAEMPPEKAGLIKILDPACGSGSFLIKALDVMDKYYEQTTEFKNMPYNRRVKALQNNIYGVDLDEKAVEIAQLNLMLRALAERRTLPNISSNIKCGNSLISGTPEELKKHFGVNWHDKKPFNWEEQFPDVFKQGGFDVIIGNPPYISLFGAEEDKEYFKSNYKSFEYQVNSFSLFIERAATLLRKGGRLGFITPAVFLSQHYFYHLRKLIFDNFNLLEVLILKHRVFGAAEIGDTCVFIFEKRPNNSSLANNIVKYAIVNSESGFNYVEYGSVPQSDFLKNPRLEISLAGNAALLDKIQKVSVPLKALATCILGIKPYQAGKGKPKQDKKTVEDRPFDNCVKLDNSYRQYLMGKDINRYVIAPREDRFIKYGDWLAEPRPTAPFERDKIILRQTSDVIRAVIDNDKYYNLNNIYNIEIINHKYCYEYLLGILNSSLLKFVYQSLVPENKRLFAEIKKINLDKLPIRALESAEGQKALASLVRRLLGLYKERLKTPENSNKCLQLKEEITKTDKQIDAEVYKLYGLTEEEIKTVEGEK